MQLASISLSDLQPIERVPIRSDCPVLLYDPNHGGWIIGVWEAESAAFWNLQYDTRLTPSHGLRLVVE